MPSTYQSIVVTAPIDTVWEKVSNFHDMSWAPDVISSCTAVGDFSATEAGAKRVLNKVFKETLTRIDDIEYVIEYSIDDGPSPVSKKDVQYYTGCIKLSPVTEGGGTFVEWSSIWDSDTKDAVEFCQDIYVALLNSLKENVK